MKRLIDADALFEILNRAAWFNNADRDEIALELVRTAPTVSPPPNDPLTLDELREMDGEPVFLETGMVDIREQLIAMWEILVEHDENRFFFTRRARGFSRKNYGKTWLAYRRKPEEG